MLYLHAARQGCALGRREEYVGERNLVFDIAAVTLGLHAEAILLSPQNARRNIPAIKADEKWNAQSLAVRVRHFRQGRRRRA